jgi:TonB family protein
MSIRTLLPLLLATLLVAHAHAQSPAKSAKGKGSGQTLASYLPKVKAALGARWAAALEPRMADFAVGSANVTFKLDADGKVTDFAVVANSSNGAFAKFCEQLVRETKFEKPPASALTDGALEIPFTFTIL